MNPIPQNVVIGTPLVSLEELGVEEHESVVHFTFEELFNEDRAVFLPHLLKRIGVFKSTSEARVINIQRQKSSRFNQDPDLDFWRNIEKPEFTFFKIGKKAFWLIVGE